MNLEATAISRTLSLPVHEHGISLDSFRFALISFINIFILHPTDPTHTLPSSSKWFISLGMILMIMF